jgi:CRISPR system Cascade subunit CasB
VSEKKADLIYKFVLGKLSRLQNDSSSSARASKAKLRRSAGKLPEKCPEIWEIVMFEMDESLIRDDNALKAIHLALALFANGENHTRDVPLGTAMRRLAPPGDDISASTKRRFDALITAKGYKEIANHLRGLVLLFKQANINLDFAKLAKDLYLFLASDNSRQKVVLSWGMDYYSSSKESKGNQESRIEKENEYEN